MTLILAVSGLGIFGDRKISCADGSKCEDLVKVASNDALCAGFAGDFGPVIKAIEAVKEGEDDAAMLARINVDGLVMKNGRILLIDSGKVWTRRKSTVFYATGTGYAEALAYLSGLTNKTKKITEQSVKQTFRYVSKVRDDCSAKYDFIPA
jgi:hypothetical protein